MAGKFSGRGAAAPAKAGGRWGGIPSAKPQIPFPDPGEYRFRIKDGELSFNPKSGNESVKVTLEIVLTDCKSTSSGDVQFVAVVSGKAKEIGEDRVRFLAMAAMGFTESEGEKYAAAYPKGEPIDNLLNGVESEASLAGRLVDAVVKLGAPCLDRDTKQPTGNHYREYEWSVVDESEQDQ
jgi:hypothetical protein